MKQVPKSLIFLPANTPCAFTGEPSILEIAIDRHIPLNHSCGGMGSCTTCRVFIEKGGDGLAPRNEIEQEHAQMRGFGPRERLACQTTAIDGLVIRVPDQSLSDDGLESQKPRK